MERGGKGEEREANESIFQIAEHMVANGRESRSPFCYLPPPSPPDGTRHLLFSPQDSVQIV